MSNIKGATPTIGINSFVLRQTRESEFTHFKNGGRASLEEVLELAKEHFHEAKPGYRPGVRLVPVPVAGFFCGVVTLEEGDKLVGRYKGRRPGEEPRKELRVLREGRKVMIGRRLRQSEGATKSPCVAVDVVLYSRETLQEDGDDCTGCEWDIIAINGRLTEEEQPIHPDTLIANHLGFEGGTATKMSPKEFESALRVSALYWKDKALLTPPGAG